MMKKVTLKSLYCLFPTLRIQPRKISFYYTQLHQMVGHVYRIFTPYDSTPFIAQPKKAVLKHFFYRCTNWLHLILLLGKQYTSDTENNSEVNTVRKTV